jgi:hypothetical protein
MEVWKSIEGLDNLYEVSNYENVKSLRNNIILKNNKTSRGYLCVSLCYNGLQKNVSVHTLVANSFCDKKEKHQCVNHKDGNKENNHYLNLEWVTYTQNNHHADKNLLRDIRGERHYRSKLNNEKVFFIRENQNRIPRKDLAKMFNVTYSVIHYVQIRKTWKHI